jgi:hypothetical protein
MGALIWLLVGSCNHMKSFRHDTLHLEPLHLFTSFIIRHTLENPYKGSNLTCIKQNTKGTTSFRHHSLSLLCHRRSCAATASSTHPQGTHRSGLVAEGRNCGGGWEIVVAGREGIGASSWIFGAVASLCRWTAQDLNNPSSSQNKVYNGRMGADMNWEHEPRPSSREMTSCHFHFIYYCSGGLSIKLTLHRWPLGCTSPQCIAVHACTWYTFRYTIEQANRTTLWKQKKLS